MKPVVYISILLSTLIVSCSKDAGEGGNSSISGTIILQARVLLNNPNTIVYEAPASDYNVYIIYGDETGPSDDVETNYDGEFTFNYLREGKYTLYVYSKDTSDAAVNGTAPAEMTIIREVEITDKKQEIQLDPITVYENNWGPSFSGFLAFCV